MTKILQPFTPDWISPPGETIADLIEERGWSQVDLARRLGYTLKHMSLLIDGKASITVETALKLENVLGSTAAFWLSMEALYRAELAQQLSETGKIKKKIPERFAVANGILGIGRSPTDLGFKVLQKFTKRKISVSKR